MGRCWKGKWASFPVKPDSMLMATAEIWSTKLKVPNASEEFMWQDQQKLGKTQPSLTRHCMNDQALSCHLTSDRGRGAAWLFIQCVTKTESDHWLFWNDLDTRGLLINHPFQRHMGSTSGAADQNFGRRFLKGWRRDCRPIIGMPHCWGSLVEFT